MFENHAKEYIFVNILPYFYLLESFYFHKTTQNRSQKYKKTALKHTFSQYSSTQFLLNLALVDSFYYFFLRLGFMGNQPFSTRFF